MGLPPTAIHIALLVAEALVEYITKKRTGRVCATLAALQSQTREVLGSASALYKRGGPCCLLLSLSIEL
jgi:hypothetical protein